MKKLLTINQKAYLFDDEKNEQITMLDGDHLILFLIDDYNRLNEKLEKILKLYESQTHVMENLIKVIKLNNEAVKKMRKDLTNEANTADHH